MAPWQADVREAVRRLDRLLETPDGTINHQLTVAAWQELSEIHDHLLDALNAGEQEARARNVMWVALTRIDRMSKTAHTKPLMAEEARYALMYARRADGKPRRQDAPQVLPANPAPEAEVQPEDR